MDSQDRRTDLKRLVDTLRRVTTAVQVLPFVYSALSIITLSVYNFIPEEAQSQLDTLFYISPICIVAFLILSKLLRLCKWNKTACILPAIPQIVGFIDCYIITLTVPEAYIINAVIIVMTVLLLVAAYKVFFR